MPLIRPSIDYSGVPEVGTQPGGEGGGQPSNARATPESFGAGVYGAVEKAGEEGVDVVKHYATMATEAKANDTIANQWAPAVAKLSGSYQQLQGADAVKGLPDFQKNLTDLHNQYLANASSPLEKQILGQYMTRHIAQEMDGAQRHQDQQLNVYEDKSHEAFVQTLSDNAITNYNNPAVVDQSLQSMDAQIQKHGIDRGQSPEQIAELQRNARGATVANMVGRAVATGDIETANKIYSDNRQLIPGYQQMEIDRTLHSENMRVNGYSNFQAIKLGQPLPATGVGHSVPEVQSTVAQAATRHGLDANDALAVASIESGFGKNVGKRGDIGQTGKGGDLQTQADNLAAEKKKSNDIATSALGRPAEPWEGYVCYQQGAGGGPALLKAASDPTARAVDVLRPLYGSNKEALSAVVNNGGNATMTAGQFLDFIKEKYQTHAKYAQCEIPQTGSSKSLDEAIITPTKEPGIPAQPAANQVEALRNYNDLVPGYITRINQIPNLDQRKAAMEAFRDDYTEMKVSAEAYKSNLTAKFQTLAIDPTFTSMSDPRLTPELRAAFADDPAQLSMLRSAARANLEETSGATGKTYGDKYVQLFTGIKNGTITDPSQLDSYMGNGLTPAGLKELREEFKPENQTQQAKLTYSIVQDQISPKNALGERTVEGERALSGALDAMSKQLAANRANKIPDAESYNADPKNKDWIGNAALPFQSTKAKQLADMRAGTGAGNTSAVANISTQFESGKLSGEAGKAALLKAYADKRNTPEDLAKLKALAIQYKYAQETPAVDVPRP